MFENYRKFEIDFAGRPLVIETGKVAQMANGSCVVRYGDTVVNVAITASENPRKDIDFFPLSVDFEERLYSVGKIPGSFLKREGRPSEKAILASRAIDRPIRPLFPKDLRNDVVVVCTVMSVDEDNSPEIAASIGTSVALEISDIPWNGPISSCFVGLIGNEIVINPNTAQRAKSDLSMTVSSTSEKIIMIEAGANIVSNEKILECIRFAHEANLPIINFIKKIKSQVGKQKFSYETIDSPTDMYEKVKNLAINKVKEALHENDKSVRNAKIKSIFIETVEKLENEYPEQENKIEQCLYKVQKSVVRDLILKGKRRVDGRGLDEIRPLSAEVGVLPRVHGSALFTRGRTQVLTAATLGPIRDQQALDGIDSEEFKRYMHHYNFPSYSVGEARASRGPSRREIGHGALAEKALLPVIPSVDDFPYAIRLVSEVTSSNGSTSQASVCGSTLALMDAGVPIKAPVCGISCGLVTENEKWLTMVDIQGLEDFFGDMDFKVAGTRDGITAIQMDLKIGGLSFEIIEEALEKTRLARIQILDNIMLKTLEKPRKNLSKYAPKVSIVTIPAEKIREVIGSGGRIVQKICSDFDVKIDIEDDGKIYIMSKDIQNCKNAEAFIFDIIQDIEVGRNYKGKVVRILDFGAMIEIAPGKEGMCHISQVSNHRVEKITDALKIGDEVLAKVTEIDSKGRINLSIRQANSRVFN